MFNVDALTDDEQAELLALGEDREAEGLESFIRRIAPHHPPPPHLQRLISVIERARREELRVCVSMPPRHGKSITILRALAWWLTHTAADTCAYLSYNSDIALSKSRICRAIAAAAGVPLMNEGLAEWRTPQGGGVLAGGAGGGLTGQGISGIVVVDDPFKNREDADSAIIREKVWDWFNTVVMTRLEGASVIAVHTRWHTDDLIGRLDDMGGWETIRFPALADRQDDPFGRPMGAALWPERYPVNVLEATRRQIGEFDFSALYQQQPRSRGTTVFGPAAYYDRAKTDLTGCTCVIGADPAASEKTHADYSVAVVMAIRRDAKPENMKAYILDVYRGQVTVPTFGKALLALQKKWYGAPINVESVAGFKALPQMLRELTPGILLNEIVPLGDKFMRAQPFASAWNDGRVMVPMENPPWLAPFLQEIVRFTGVKDAHDDQVDAAAHAWNAIAGAPPPIKRGAVSRPERWV